MAVVKSAMTSPFSFAKTNGRSRRWKVSREPSLNYTVF